MRRNCLECIVRWFRGHDLAYFMDGNTGDFYLPVFRARPFFAWYDIWVGVFIDHKKRQLYIFPLPMLGVQVGYQARRRHTNKLT